MAIEKRFIVSSNEESRNMGNNIPEWYGKASQTDLWHFVPDVPYTYNIVNNKDIYIQYGRLEQGWASAKFLGQSLDIISETELPDKSIDVEVEVKANFMHSRKTGFSQSGYRVEHKIYLNDKLQYSYIGNTLDNFDKGQKQSLTFTVNVKPKENNPLASFLWTTVYPDGQFNNNEIRIGFGLYNPNNEPPPEPVTYIPMAIRKSNQWKDLDSNNGFIEKRSNATWKDFSEEEVETSKQVNKGKNRGRENGQWKQLPKMKGGNVDE